MGKAYEKEGKYEEAIKEYKSALNDMNLVDSQKINLDIFNCYSQMGMEETGLEYILPCAKEGIPSCIFGATAALASLKKFQLVIFSFPFHSNDFLHQMLICWKYEGRRNVGSVAKMERR